jgi:hypothetical protein
MNIISYPSHLGDYLFRLYGAEHRGCSAQYDGTSYILHWDPDLMGAPPPSIDEVEAAAVPLRRMARQEERVAQRLAAQTGGFAFAGATFASDRDESLPLLTHAVLSAQMALAQGPEAAAAFGAALGDGWRDTTGTGRITTAEGILALHAAFVAYGAACDRHSQSLKAQIDAAQSVEELDAIDLTAGWPA